MANHTSKIVNCDLCGRDTPNKCRICRFCTGGSITEGRPERISQHERESRELWDLMLGDEYTREDDVTEDIREAIDDMLN